jgi:hypothetical protein
MKFVVSLFLALAVTACSLHQSSVLSKYELYEAKQQCAESVPRIVKYDAIGINQTVGTVLAHYNPHLSMCFVALERLPTNGARGIWVIASSQSYQWVPIEMHGRVWKGLMEDDDLDMATSSIK